MSIYLNVWSFSKNSELWKREVCYALLPESNSYSITWKPSHSSPTMLTFVDQLSWEISSEVLHQVSYYSFMIPLSGLWTYLHYIIWELCCHYLFIHQCFQLDGAFQSKECLIHLCVFKTGIMPSLQLGVLKMFYNRTSGWMKEGLILLNE